jgi:hypothetical protein
MKSVDCGPSTGKLIASKSSQSLSQISCTPWENKTYLGDRGTKDDRQGIIMEQSRSNAKIDNNQIYVKGSAQK